MAFLSIHIWNAVQCTPYSTFTILFRLWNHQNEYTRIHSSKWNTTCVHCADTQLTISYPFGTTHSWLLTENSYSWKLFLWKRGFSVERNRKRCKWTRERFFFSNWNTKRWTLQRWREKEWARKRKEMNIIDSIYTLRTHSLCPGLIF